MVRTVYNIPYNLLEQPNAGLTRNTPLNSLMHTVSHQPINIEPIQRHVILPSRRIAELQSRRLQVKTWWLNKQDELNDKIKF